MDNLESHKVFLAAIVTRQSDILCYDVWSFRQNWPEQWSGNGASTGAAARLKLNLWVNAAVQHRVTRRREAVMGQCVTVSWWQSLFHSVGTLPGAFDGCFLFCLLSLSLCSFVRWNAYPCHPCNAMTQCYSASLKRAVINNRMQPNLNVIKCWKRRCSMLNPIMSWCFIKIGSVRISLQLVSKQLRNKLVYHHYIAFSFTNAECRL